MKHSRVCMWGHLVDYRYTGLQQCVVSTCIRAMKDMD